MDLSLLVDSAELRFKQLLEDFFITCYEPKYLPSHGIEHHRRVWGYSTELLFLVKSKSPELPSRLIIASYMHDIGMSVEIGIRHGKHSRNLCTEFLKINRLSLADYKDVLDVIENHDNKDYSENHDANDLLKILSVADDLDAFGFTGIYRYSEIYLTRSVNKLEFGHLIINNAGKRFDNFNNIFGSFEDLISREIKRYDILFKFFDAYNRQVKDYHFGNEKPKGYCGVIEVVTDIMKNKIALKDIISDPEIYSDDPVIKWFFQGLSKELS